MSFSAKSSPPWNQILASLPSPHLLQTWEWGQLKVQYGWQPFHLVWDDKTSEVLKTSEVSLKNVQAAALVLVRAIPVGGFAARLSVVYRPSEV